MISPLWTITKKELTTYLELVAPSNHSKQGSPTDYNRGDHNRDINYFMTDLLSSVYPGLGFSLFESLENMVKSYNINKPNFHECKNCGIVYHDAFMQGSLVDEHYCDHCLYLEGLGHASRVKISK